MRKRCKVFFMFWQKARCEMQKYLCFVKSHRAKYKIVINQSITIILRQIGICVKF